MNKAIVAQEYGNMHGFELSKHLKVKYEKEKGFFAYNESGQKLFQIYSFDNGPDYPSEGLFRIIYNNKIGFADLKGEVIIRYQFDAALPFANGLAAYCMACEPQKKGEHSEWQGGRWGFINTMGDKIIPAEYDEIISDFRNGIATVKKEEIVFNLDREGNKVEMKENDYNKWVKLLGEAARLNFKLVFGNKIKIEILNTGEFNQFNFYNYNNGLVHINIFSPESNHLLVSFLVIPWQNFSEREESSAKISPISAYELLTVTDCSIIYSSGLQQNEKNPEYKLAKEAETNFKRIINFASYNTSEELEHLNIPEGVQIISYDVFPGYIKLEIAIPGSRLPSQEEWSKVSRERMIYLCLIPDIGNIKKSWVKPGDPIIDTYYTSVEKDLLNLFETTITRVDDNIKDRENIYNNFKSELRQLFNSANSYVNYLYDIYEKRLARWLTIKDDSLPEEPIKENIFGDYIPKLTEDTVIDYMPEIHDDYVALPSPDIKNLGELLRLFEEYAQELKNNPGYWEEGNPILGGREKEYRASREELLLAEIGKLITFIKSKNTPGLITEQIDKKEGVSLEYREFSFIHFDVMGSGRFFYIEGIEDKKVELP